MAALISVMILPVGCDVRDEEARHGPQSPWPPQMVERLTAPSQRATESTPSEPAIELVDGYAAGSRRAADTGLPMLLVFRASWCRWSDGFVAHALDDAHLAKLADNCICVAVDPDREPATCRSFGVHAFPTAIVLDRERRESFRASGADARAGLAVALDSILADQPRRIAGQSATTPH